MFGIGYGELEAFIRVAHRIDEGGSALVARFRYMQRMGFPEGINTGKGVRATYLLPQVLKTMLACEVLETGATPTRAVRVVRDSWVAAAPSLALGWSAVRGDVRAADRPLLAMAPGALRGMGEVDDPDAAVLDPLAPMTQGELRAWLAGPPRGDRDGGRFGAARLVLDPMRLAAALREELPGVSGMVREDVDAAYRALGGEVFGGSPEADWPVRWNELRRGEAAAR